MSCPDVYQAVAEPRGMAGCPCLDAATVDPYFALTVSAVVAGESYSAFNGDDPVYKPGYGTGCGPHDLFTAPYCTPFWNKGPSVFAANGGEVFTRFCADSWCWVDPENCDVPGALAQGYFPEVEGLAYSYETCGAVNVFSSEYEADSEPDAEARTMMQLFIGLALLASILVPACGICFCVYGPCRK